VVVWHPEVTPDRLVAAYKPHMAVGIVSESMLKLSPKQCRDLAACICGGAADETPFLYRTAAGITSFIKFSGAARPSTLAGSRFGTALQFVEHANLDSAHQGASGLSLDLEQIMLALLDRGEFEDEATQSQAVASIEHILGNNPVKLVTAPDRSVSVQPARVGRNQRVLDQQIHTAFGSTLFESDLHAARVHYSKAKRFLDSSPPDFANSCKESVSSIEAVATALTGEADLPKALRRAVAGGLVHRPLDEVALKLYAYRGNEPGVGHGQSQPPRVGREEAELLFNLAGAIGKYLKEKVTKAT
jgi:hypothetical protein